jgi:predicted  nucleic acid-binding Zn-ribbon protein
MEEMDWNMASNVQIKEKLEALKKDFDKKQKKMKKIVDSMDELHNQMFELSKNYTELKSILNKREGKVD